MVIGGLQKFSLVDYPGKTCAIIFTRGCNFRCRYCHNPELVIPEQYTLEIPLKVVFDFLETRRGKLDAVEITGGEPTQHADLIGVISQIKDMGFLVKLDSNGSRPEVLKTAIDQKLVDYLAMDVKAPLKDYVKIMGWQVPAEKLQQSISLIMNSGIDYEFRTTIVKSLTSKDDLREIAKTIKGAKRYFLQKFIPAKLVDSSCNNEVSYSDRELQELAQELMRYVVFCGVR
ncbi:anaerobic ribonucleoside-triphosphate reductase activating protein [Candidatus Gottesmanbacteria bacterium RIFOXYB1_FULL_47_11]|uniref:Anaerobic ribonucleoside-triphosphate reductase activating protein n=1 Tax=Candidatus Gottesmanbacteria bacterium RIFOXYB1_FULL_47_11 TaxID=1798401 RepID=A0A1F6BDI7_9BACT|nr:MAG: anaerobic ribonucleoside-triphosphate reductase activating protein [Candidatus Gottesmanbacteria bacterium RIFOXYB1_FULL_47_11]